MLIYNLFPLLAGRYAEWKPHLERARSMGFNWVFINPIQKPGASGSLYSIADYFELNPLFTDASLSIPAAEQARRAIQYAHELGLKVMLDLVINHCAVDNPIVASHPDWFERENGQLKHPFCIENGEKNVWYDLVKFDHEHSRDAEGLYKYLVSIMEYMIDLGCDGFRCDAAYQLPRKLWMRLIAEVHRRHPSIQFIAETLGCTADETRETAQAGFDYVFNSSKWWNFRDSWLFEQYNLTRDIVPSIGFPESHDTPRLWADSWGNEGAMKQALLFTFLFGAGGMIPMGFEYGFEKRLHVVNSRPTDWEVPHIDLTEFIRRLNELKAQHQVLREECPTHLIELDNRQVLVMWKGSVRSRQEALILLNTNVHERQNVYCESLRRFVQSGAALRCVSPENPLEHVSEPFQYELRPGEAIVLVAER